jgi:hypothetical protein
VNWHELHQLYVEPEIDSLVAQQPRCKQCGCFLPRQPNLHTYRIIPAKWEYQYDGQGIAGMAVLAEEKEPIKLWICSKCHCQNEINDVYPN